LHTWIFGYKTRTHVPIELKLGTHKGLVKVHHCTNFGWGRKIRSKVCHAYRVNRLQESVEIWHVDEVTIRAVPFVVWVELSKKPLRYETKSKLGQNYRWIWIMNKKKIHLFQAYQANRLEKWTENWSVVGMVIIESPCNGTEESKWISMSYEVKPDYMHPVRNRDILIEHSFLFKLKVIHYRVQLG